VELEYDFAQKLISTNLYENTSIVSLMFWSHNVWAWMCWRKFCSHTYARARRGARGTPLPHLASPRMCVPMRACVRARARARACVRQNCLFFKCVLLTVYFLTFHNFLTNNDRQEKPSQGYSGGWLQSKSRLLGAAPLFSIFTKFIIYQHNLLYIAYKL